MTSQLKASVPGSGGASGACRLSVAAFSVLLASALVVLVSAPAAFGASKYVPVGQIPPPYPENQTWTPTSFNALRAESVAVSGVNGHIYVADSGRGAIYDFESISDSTPTRWNGQNTPSGSFGGENLSVAVDDTTGDVYVADKSHAVIDKFDGAGNSITSFGDTQPNPNGQLAGSATPAGSFSPAQGGYTSFGIAVDQATHDLYAIDAHHQVVDIFDEGGAYLRQITDTPEGLYRFGGDYATGIAVNASSGNVYLTDWAGPNLVFEFDSSGNYVSTWDGSNTPDGQFSGSCTGCTLISVATEDASERVFVGAMASHAVDIFNPDGTFVSPQVNASDYSGSNLLSYVAGVAIDQATGYLYESDSGTVAVFRPVIVPDVSIDPVSGLTSSAATLSGHLDPAGGGNATGCHFDYISNFKFLQNTVGNGQADPWSGALQAPCTTNPATSLPYSTATDVSAEIGGLSPGAEYRFRLVVSNAEGVNKAVGPAFATEGIYRFAAGIGSAGSGDGQLSKPEDVAVDNSTGEIYVADTGNNRVVKFDSSGNFVGAWGWGVADGDPHAEVCSSGCQAGIAGNGPGQFEAPRFIEVDNSAGPSVRDVYVANASSAVVQKFTPAGNLVSGWAEGGRIDLSKGGAIGGITVSSLGDLFAVTDDQPYNWTQIGQDGVSRSQTATEGFFGLGTPSGTGIDIDSTGGFYEPQPTGGGGGNILYKNPGGEMYSGHSVYPNAYTSGGNLLSSGLAVDRQSGDLYVDQGTFIDRFPASAGCVPGQEAAESCAPQDSFGFGELTSASGLAVDSSSKSIYAADPGANRIASFARRPVPSATTGAVEPDGDGTVTLTGDVAPSSEDIVDCRFEYGTDTGYALGTAACSPATPISQQTHVSAEISGLVSQTTYHYRVVAEGSNGLPAFGTDRAFTAGGGGAPLVSSSAPGSITPTSASLNAEINPNQASTVYRFQYGPTATYGSQTPMSEPIGEDAADHTANADLTGLQPKTTYHFRVLAINFNGVTAGPDRTFSTPGAPAIVSSGVSAVTQTTATLGAEIMAGFSETTYHFEYGPTASYGSVAGGEAGADNAPHALSAPVAGLSPGTTYHVRVVAANGIGDVAGPDQTFTTTAAPVAVPEVPPCKKSFVRRKGKCVKHLHKKHAHRHGHKQRHHKRGNGNG